MRRSRMIQRLRFCGGLSGSSRLYKIKSSTIRRYVRIGNNVRRRCLLVFEISLRRNRVWRSFILTRLHPHAHLRVCPRINPSSRMSRGGPIHHAETTPVFGGSHHFIQGEYFHTFGFLAYSFRWVLCRCLIFYLIHLRTCNKWLTSCYGRRHTNELSTL